MASFMLGVKALRAHAVKRARTEAAVAPCVRDLMVPDSATLGHVAFRDYSLAAVSAMGTTEQGRIMRGAGVAVERIMAAIRAEVGAPAARAAPPPNSSSLRRYKNLLT